MRLAQIGLALLAFAIAVVYWPGILSPSVAPRWWVLCIGAPLLLSQIRIQWHFAHTLFLMFFAFCCATLIWSIQPWDTWDLIWILGSAGCAYLVAAEINADAAWIALATGIAIQLPLVLMQGRGHGPFDLTPLGGRAATFLNRDTFAEIAVVATVGVGIVLRDRFIQGRAGAWLWLLTAATLACALLPGSRGAYLALGSVVGLWLCWPRRWYVLVALAAIFAGAIYYDMIIMDRWATVSDRLDFWQWTMANLTVWGRGFGTYGTAFFWTHAHNDFLEVVFELGIGSTLIAFPIAYLLFTGGPQRLIVIAVLVEGLVSFPLHNPATVCMVAIALGGCCRHQFLSSVCRSEGRTYNLGFFGQFAGSSEPAENVR